MANQIEISAQRRYTPEQVLRGLQSAFAEILGTKGVIAADQRIEQFLIAEKRWIWEELDLLDLAFELDRYFDFSHISRSEWNRCMSRDWEVWFKSHSANADLDWFTFGALADFIAGRAHAIQVRPAMVLGRECLPAGAFRTIEEVVQRVAPGMSPFAPSTRLDAALRGQPLRRVWDRLRWLSDNRLPPRRLFITDRIRAALRSGPGVFVGLAMALIGALAIQSVCVFFVFVPLAFGCPEILLRSIEYWLNPIPTSHPTFREVAYSLAESVA